MTSTIQATNDACVVKILVVMFGFHSNLLQTDTKNKDQNLIIVLESLYKSDSHI